MKILLPGLWLLLLALPHLAQASGCGQADPQGAAIEKYQSFSDGKIKQHCTYDMKRIEPRATQAELDDNMKRTSACVRGVTRMREISRDYVALRNRTCTAAQNPTNCAEGASQGECLLGAGKLAAETRQGEIELSALLADAQAELKELERYQRLRHRGYREDLAILRTLAPHLKTDTSTPRDHNGKGPYPRDISAEELPAMPQPRPAALATSDRPIPRPSSVSEKFKNSQPQPGTPEQRFAAPDNSPPVESQISGLNESYRPPPQIDARNGGVRTLAEYENRLPHLIREQEESLQRIREFDEAAKIKQTQHAAAASQLAMQAAKLYLGAKKLGVADEEMNTWASENREVVKQEEQRAEAQAPSARLASESEEEEKSSGLNGSQALLARQELSGLLADETLESSSIAAGADDAGASAAQDAEPMLENFGSKLAEDSQAPSRRKISSLRDQLRQRLEGAQGGKNSAEELGSMPAELAKQILAETEELTKRDPASTSSSREKQGLDRLDVDGALEDIEAQLRELDFQAGILEAGSDSLFLRVGRVVKAGYKSGLIAAD